ncbi:MAG: bifunctional nuclease domain-containing protein [Clostridia bacterium]|jgi:bifunctional DNase/RNase|nr:bifunctional nuclease family protein [Spirochaetia bacterium]
MGSNTFVRADIWTIAQTEQGNVVLVRPRESDLAVPIFIGQLETQAILIGLGKVSMPRPLTHDLLLSLSGRLGAELIRVEICDLREKTFFARLILLRDGTELEIDARPSDAIALAVRCEAEVFIAENIVEEAGIPVEMVRDGQSYDIGDGDSSHTDDSRTSFDSATGASSGLDAGGAEGERERLKHELEAAIAEEDYERAALIRDRLKQL